MADSGPKKHFKFDTKKSLSTFASTNTKIQTGQECSTKQHIHDPSIEDDFKYITKTSPDPSNTIIIQKVTAYVQQYMSHYDASHDFTHIMRVLGLARHIASVEAQQVTSSGTSFPQQSTSNTPPLSYNPTIITLSALLHDVGDRKYLKAGENSDTMVFELLKSFGADKALAETIQRIVNNVSFSNETKSAGSRENVKKLVEEIPELGVVQDADRLDAIGAVGIGRTFTYGGAVGRVDGDGRPMQETVQHFIDKLERLEGLMKTVEGRRLAAVRTRRLKLFREWWEEETFMSWEGLKEKVT